MRSTIGIGNENVILVEVFGQAREYGILPCDPIVTFGAIFISSESRSTDGRVCIGASEAYLRYLGHGFIYNSHGYILQSLYHTS